MTYSHYELVEEAEELGFTAKQVEFLFKIIRLVRDEDKD